MLESIKNILPYEKRLKLKYKLRHYKSLLYFNNLTKIATIHKTDKYGSHFYTPHYQNHFKKFKYKKINILEIGVGGYWNPLHGGNSLRMWKSYFPFAKIFSLDIYDKSFIQENRIKIYKGSQIDKGFLMDVCNEICEIDLIIDDGSHLNEHVITTFKILFPKLKKGGIYVVEDTQTSYWENYGGDSVDLNKEGTIYHFFKQLIDSLNSMELVRENYQKTYYDKHIISMHFYHNMIFIYKGDNDEPSNYIKNNKLPNG